MFPKELIPYQNKLYWVYRKIKKHFIKENCVDELKDMLSCEIVLKHTRENNDYYYFMREIPELEIIKEDESIKEIGDVVET